MKPVACYAVIGYIAMLPLAFHLKGRRPLGRKWIWSIDETESFERAPLATPEKPHPYLLVRVYIPCTIRIIHTRPDSALWLTHCFSPSSHFVLSLASTTSFLLSLIRCLLASKASLGRFNLSFFLLFKLMF